MAQPGAVERFVVDPEAVKRIRRTFAGLYSLDAVSCFLYKISHIEKIFMLSGVLRFTRRKELLLQFICL